MLNKLALVVILAAAAFVCYDVLLPPVPDYGVRSTNAPQGVAVEERVSSVVPNSPAAAAGIRPGDTVSFGSTPFEAGEAQFAQPGTRVNVLVNGTRSVTLVAPSAAFQPLFILLLAIRLAFLAVAALLAWRRPEDHAARALVLFLLCFGLLIGLNNTVPFTPLLSVILVQMGGTVLLLVGTAAAATFAANFPSGVAKPVPRTLARTTQAVIALCVAVTIAAPWLMRSQQTISNTTRLISWLFAASVALVVAILIVAYVQGAPSERQRRRWVFLMLGIGLVAVTIDIVVQIFVGYSQIFDYATLLLTATIPFGLAYAILRYRVIDVGFVVNRAVVFGIVSVIIVGIFVIVETLASAFIEQHSRVGSIALQLVVALVLGFSFNFIQARVERAVDRILFRQRYLDEAAIAEFTHDAHYITAVDVLLERCVATTIRHAHAIEAGVWLRDELGLYEPRRSSFVDDPQLDENDPAVVAMRARRIVADLHALGSALPGAFAFPMIVRGELLGALVCGNKEHLEAYTPGEVEELRNMASAVGHALDAVRIRELEDRVRVLEATTQITPAGA